MLSRKIFISDYHNAPICVLNDILESEDIISSGTRDNKLKLIDSISVESVVFDFNTGQAMSHVARFVNPRCNNFTKSKLKLAYRHIMLWTGDKIPPVTGLNYGSATPECLYTVDACQLYRSCVSRGIDTNIDMSIHDMYTLCTMYEQSSRDLRTMLNMISMCVTRGKLVSVINNLYQGRMMHTPSTRPDKTPLINGYLSPLMCLEACPPSNAEEAIIACAVKYRIIISDMDPMDAWKALENAQPITHPKYIVNPSWWNMSITFHMKYSEWYTDDDYAQIMKHECVSDRHSLQITPEVIIGIHPTCIEDTTFIYMDKVSDISNVDECLTFDGKVLSRTEYIEYLQNKKALLNPVTEQLLGSTATAKLRLTEWSDLLIIMDTLQILKESSRMVNSDYLYSWELLLKAVHAMRGDEAGETSVVDEHIRKFYDSATSSMLESKLVTVHKHPVHGLDTIYLGTTLGERLDALGSDDPNGCLRLMSNVLGHTVWWNITGITGTPPFDLEAFEGMS